MALEFSSIMQNLLRKDYRNRAANSESTASETFVEISGTSIYGNFRDTFFTNNLRTKTGRKQAHTFGIRPSIFFCYFGPFL